MEFHIPYFALRKGLDLGDKRNAPDGLRRKSRPLPLARNMTEKLDYYHEAQTAFILTGIDEWFWVSYCCVDSYFGSEPNQLDYLNEASPVDPASCSIWLQYPSWNPREYFLTVASRRLAQATQEWVALVTAFEERLLAYVGDLFSLSLTSRTCMAHFATGRTFLIRVR